MTTALRCILLLITIILFTYCSKEEELEPPQSCDFPTIADADLFRNETSHRFTIDSLEITGDCLSITYSSSGCSGDTWQTQLIDAVEIAEVVPPQRRLRFTVHDLESCDAWITKVTSFDISNLQLPDGNEVGLRMINNDEILVYKY